MLSVLSAVLLDDEGWGVGEELTAMVSSEMFWSTDIMSVWCLTARLFYECKEFD